MRVSQSHTSLSHRIVRAVLLLLQLSPLGVRGAMAQPAPQSIDQMFHESFGIRQGIPGSVVNIAQTADGYLWLAHPGGITRFDGVRFERFTPSAGEVPTSVFAMQTTPDGALWLGSRVNGVARLKDERIVSFGSAEGFPAGLVYDLSAGPDGTIWAATAGGAAWFDGARWHRPDAAAGIPTGPAQAVLVARDGAVWMVVGNTLLVRPAGTARFQSTGVSGSILDIAEAPDGTIWLADRVAGARPLRAPAHAGAGADAISTKARQLVFDRTGSLWIATSDTGIWRSPLRGPEHVQRYATGHGLSADDVFAVFEDREGNVWVGTGSGLDFFRAASLVAAPLPKATHGIRLAPGADGSLWIGSQNQALMHLRGDHLERVPGVSIVHDVHRDRRNRLWVATSGAIVRYDGGQLQERIATPENSDTFSIAVDADGGLWAVVRNRALYVWRGGQWTRPSLDGLPRDAPPVRLVHAGTDGRLWLTLDDRLARVDGDRVTMFSPDDGLRTGRIGAISSAGSRLWLAGSDGIAVVNEGRVRMLHGLDRDAIGNITGIVEADDGSVWANASRGVVYITAGDVRRAIEDVQARPQFRVFDYLDGGIGGDGLVPSQSAVKAADGRLWFVGFYGAVSIDPAHIPANPLPPPVHVRQIAGGGGEWPLTNGLRLPVGTTTFQIRYTALSLAMPERVRFRHRLDGVDRDWQDAGVRREAQYTNIAPGDYTFRVIAANNDGVWNESGAAVTFTVPPAFYQTAWFRGVIVLSLAGIAVLAYRRHVRRITVRLEERLEERLGERERIARELHDTLLQGVQGLILHFEAAATSIPADQPAAKSLEAVLARADDVLAESRARVLDLRRQPEAARDLPQALADAGKELGGRTDLEIRVVVEGEPRPLHPVVRDEAYWIGREALLNAFNHAGARHIEIAIVYERRELRMRVRDDGRGMDPDVLSNGARVEHWGLPGMRERAARIAARVDLWSRQGAGTEVELRVPAGIAYRQVAARWWWRRRPASGLVDG